jgi:tRNA(Phe) wybutosine-synthesizing methylase Tyw3
MVVAARNAKTAMKAVRVSMKAGFRTGAGEGIRTLDPNLGKVVLYP